MRLRRETGDFSIVITSNAATIRKNLNAEDLIGAIIVDGTVTAVVTAITTAAATLTLTAGAKNYIVSDNLSVSATAADQPATQAQTATQPATEPATKPASQPSNEAAKSVTDQYDNINLDGLSLKVEDENDDVLQMQQRLEDLGYLKKEDENVTGYYGEMTAQAVKDFQKRNGLKETGVADNATLKALFMSDAKKAS